MNLVNGAGNAEFQFHYPDTVMYVKIENTSLNQLVLAQIDSSASIEIDRISVFNNNCIGNYIYDVNTTLNGRKFFNLNLFHKASDDTIMLRLNKSSYNNSCGGCDTTNLKLTFNFSQGSGGTAPCNGNYSSICDNLVQNGDFELHTPTLALADDLSNPSWGEYQFDNQVCEWFQALTGLNSPDYYSSYWNSFTLMGAPQCSFCSSLSLTSSNWMCNIPTQTNNIFFDSNNNGYAGLFTDNASQNSELLKGNLNPNVPLISTHLYYVEGNFAQPNGNEYFGHMELDISNQLNFIQSNYNSLTTGIEISFDAFDHDPINPWKKFYTVFTSGGDETNVYLGNLTKKYTPMQSTSVPTNCPVLQSSSMSYMLIDNIVVKEFLADAGGPTVNVCNNQPTVIGGSCLYPSATYNWQPAILFNNNTLANPTITTNTNVTCTLTVTITMPDGITQATTPPAYLNVVLYQQPTIAISGSNSIPMYTATNLTVSGAISYSWTGTNGVTGNGATLNTGALFQQEIFTVTATDANGCTAIESFVVDVVSMPGDCGTIATQNNVVVIPDGYTSTQLKNDLLNSHPNNIAMLTNNGNGNYTYSINSTTNYPLTFILAGTFTIDNATGLNFNFFNNFIGVPPPPDSANIYCFDGSNIINNSYLTMTSCSLIACNNMWKGITNNKNLYLNGCYFADAENAVHLTNGSNYKISTNVFDNNLYGILMGGIGGGQISGVDYSNIYRSTAPLKPAFPTMFFHPTWSEAGIKVFNVNYVQIGAVPSALGNSASITISNRFENINCGINIFNSNVKVVNSWFKDLTHLNPSPAGTLIGLQPEGAGIYARSVGIPKSLSVEPIPGYTGNEFENCKYGIKTFRNSIEANNIRMNNVANGITAQNSIMCSYNLQSNRINAWFNGIDINNAEFANSVVIGFNQINMNFLMGYFGINVTAATIGNLENTRITYNTVTIANSYNAGIQTSALNGARVNCNQIKRTATNPFMLWYSLNGISSLTCPNIALSQNGINWAQGFSGLPNSGIDFLLELSDDAVVNCNTTGVSRVGLQVAGPNTNATIRANNFGSNSTALYYDNSGITGPQPADPINDPTEGNRWLGTNTFNAYNAASTADVQGSKYYVNSNQPTINYPDPQLIFPAQGWFLNLGLQSYQPVCLASNCDARRSSPMGNIDYYRSIANRSLTTNGYPEQTLWMAQNSLVRLLSIDTTLLNTDDSLNYFYYSPDARTLRDIDEIGRNNNAYEAQRNLFSHAIMANDSLMSIIEAQLIIINSQMTDSLLNDSALLIQRIALLTQYEYLKQMTDSLSISLNLYHKNNLSEAAYLNDELEPRNANEQILKTINKIYFALRDNDYEYISNDDSTMLAYIAHLCPLAAGHAVYKARDMYALLVDSVLYQDSLKCSNEGYARESLIPFAPKLKEQVSEVSYFKAFPVPAQNTINLSYNELKSAANVYVYDMEGRLLLTKTIANGNRTSQLDLRNIPVGVYTILLLNNERTERTKISVIK
jgi:hypothetical protein